MEVELIALSGVVFTGKASELRLPTKSGEIGVLPNHEDLVTVLVPGELEVVPVHGDKTESYVIFGGLADISPSGARILVDEIEHVEALIESEIEAALAEARRLEAGAKNVHQELQASRMVTRHGVRLRAVRRRRPVA